MGACASSGALEGGEDEMGGVRPMADGTSFPTSKELAAAREAQRSANAEVVRLEESAWRMHVAGVFVRRLQRVALARAWGTLGEAVRRRRVLRRAVAGLRRRALVAAFRAWAHLTYGKYVALATAAFTKVTDGTLLRSALTAWYYHTDAAIVARAHATRVDRLTLRLRAAERRVKELEVEKDASREALHRGWVFLQQSSQMPTSLDTAPMDANTMFHGARPPLWNGRQELGRRTEPLDTTSMHVGTKFLGAPSLLR